MQLPTLLSVLNNRYLKRYNTQIIGGFDEPFYQAFKAGKPACIQFSHDYIRSALHELSHWCVAGVDRRKKDDYGYWYAADGRTQQQQDLFYQVEIKPQAIEWGFSLLIGVAFETSVDNLHNDVHGAQLFTQAVHKKLLQYLTEGFPKRVSEIMDVLAFYQGIRGVNDYIVQNLQQKKQLTC